MSNVRFWIFMFIFLRLGVPSLGDPSADATDLIEALKRTYRATEPSPELQKVIGYCEKISQFKGSVIYLASPSIETSRSISSNSNPLKIVLIQTHQADKKKSDQFLTMNILHEIGHFSNGDHDHFCGLAKEEWRKIAFLWLSLAIALGTFDFLNEKTKFPKVANIANSVAAHELAAVGLTVLHSYIKSKKELAADSYASQHLLADNNPAPVLSFVHHFLASHDNHLKKGKGELPNCFVDNYPSDLQRARAFLSSMKNKSIDLADCIKHHPDCEVKTELPELVKKYCHEFMQKSA